MALHYAKKYDSITTIIHREKKLRGGTSLGNTIHVLFWIFHNIFLTPPRRFSSVTRRAGAYIIKVVPGSHTDPTVHFVCVYFKYFYGILLSNVVHD